MAASQTEKPAGYRLVKTCADGWANLRSALVCKPEVLWRLTKRKNLRGIDRLQLVLLSSGCRLTRDASIDHRIC